MCRKIISGNKFVLRVAISYDRESLLFCRHRMVAMPAKHMSKQNKSTIGALQTTETNLSLLEVSYFLLHNR